MGFCFLVCLLLSAKGFTPASLMRKKLWLPTNILPWLEIIVLQSYHCATKRNLEHMDYKKGKWSGHLSVHMIISTSTITYFSQSTHWKRDSAPAVPLQRECKERQPLYFETLTTGYYHSPSWLYLIGPNRLLNLCFKNTGDRAGFVNEFSHK